MAIDDGIEEALWTTVRALEEAQILLHRVAEHMTQHDEQEASVLIARSNAAGADSEAVRRIALGRESLNPAPGRW